LLGCLLVGIEIHTGIRTLRLKVKAEGYAWLNAAAVEVNQVWNFANETSHWERMGRRSSDS